MMNKKIIASIAVSIALVFFLLSQVEMGEIIGAFKNIPASLVMAGFVFYALSYLFRALRFKVLLHREIPLGTLFNIVAVHTMWTNILPFRSGELSYFYLLKKKGGAASYVSGVPSLVLARVFDLFAIGALFLVSFATAGELPREMKITGFILIGLLSILLLFLLFLISQRERFLRRLKSLALKLKLKRIKLVGKLLGTGEEILEGFNAVKSKRLMYLTALLSLFIWLFVYLFNLALIRAVGVEITVLHAFFISSFFVLAGLFPIHGFAGFGTTEGIWVITIIWFGVTKEDSIVTGFQLHAMALFFVILLGVAGSIAMSEFMRRPRRIA